MFGTCKLITSPTPSTARTWEDVVKRAEMRGVPLNILDNMIRRAQTIGMSPKDLEDDMAFGLGGMGVPPPPSDVARAPICQFTLCMAAPASNMGAPADPAKLLGARLRLDSILATTLRNVHIFVGADTTIVFAIKPTGEFVSFEDETAIFPSDKMVAAFHLLLKAS